MKSTTLILAVALAVVSRVCPAGETSAFDRPERLQGMVLRAQQLPQTEGGGEECRLLLSTSEGLCAVRVPGDGETWESFSGAVIEIFGVQRGMEFIVTSRTSVRVVKHPPTSPDSLPEVLPAGELIYRRQLDRDRVQREKALVRLHIAVAAVSGASASLIAVLLFFFLRKRRQARRLKVTLDVERRRTGHLHENVEQRLVGAQMLLKTAIDMSGSVTPAHVAKAVEQVADVLAKTNSEVHTSTAATARRAKGGE